MTAEPNRNVQPAVRTRRLPSPTLPVARDDRRGWSVLSLLLHALVIALLLVPLADHNGLVIERPQGAGGAGPAGGGGGGRRGTGGVRERAHYIRLAQAAPTPQPVVTPPKPQPTPTPVVPPPVVKPPEITPQSTPAPKAEIAKVAQPTAPVPGTGGGTGNDGTAGSGPGSGGGVGSGVGPGRGSGNGPGTGGGVQANYPPSATELFIPPLPMPDKVRGFHLVAEFDVDSTGKVLGFNFTHTGDRGYDKRLSEVLGATKFRPGTKPDGTPIRMKAQIIYDF